MPTSTHTFVSRVVNSPIQTVFGQIRLMDFKWDPEVERTEVRGNKFSDQVGSNHMLFMKDGKRLEIKLVELSDLQSFLTYEAFDCKPDFPVTSAIYTIRCREVTDNASTLVEFTSDFSVTDNASTLVEFTSNFSSDATIEFIKDVRVKQAESLKGLK
ncbi:hypothetical protein T484DRAFT_1765721 [Baffinella frigidus]|nr:hypothetical protein T484DRAFT_1765721 [Cryptophyta sp. CCMP2293]